MTDMLTVAPIADFLKESKVLTFTRRKGIFRTCGGLPLAGLGRGLPISHRSHPFGGMADQVWIADEAGPSGTSNKSLELSVSQQIQ